MPSNVRVLGLLSMLAVFLAAVTGPFGAFFAIFAAVLALVCVAEYVSWRKRKRYDLRELLDLHREGGPVSDEDVPDIEPDAGVLCPCCGTVYAAWLLVCPHCRHG